MRGDTAHGDASDQVRLATVGFLSVLSLCYRRELMRMWGLMLHVDVNSMAGVAPSNIDIHLLDAQIRTLALGLSSLTPARVQAAGPYLLMIFRAMVSRT